LYPSAWPKAAGGTQWEVLRAHVHTAIKAAKTQAWEDSRDGRTTGTDRTEYHLSLREACLEAGVSMAESVRKAQEALATSGWLILHDDPTPTHAATWELSIPQNVADATPLRNVAHATHSGFTWGESVYECVAFATADYWRRGGGLGPFAHRLFLFLSANGASKPREIRAAMGIHRATIWRKLEEMLTLDMVRKNPDGSWEPLDFDEDLVLRATGTEGATERHRARIHAEREAWKTYREDRYGERSDADRVTGEIKTQPLPESPCGCRKADRGRSVCVRANDAVN
jgi:hypothetical protein